MAMARSQISTRSFVAEDYDAAVALWNSAEGVELSLGDSREEIAGFLQRNPELSRVAEENGTLLGVALCGHDGRRGWIYHLAVAPEQRGRGIARRLLEECVSGLRGAGIQRAIILVARDNGGGHEFWLRHGWEDLAGARAMSLDL